jgi:luciferase family oxidoreductase group 1
MVGQVAAVTQHLRVGTGGVLMPYYSPLKVAEVFRMLEALYPGRIDLGLGRAPGGDLRTAEALSGGAYRAAERFPEQVEELVGLLDGNLPGAHPSRGIRVQPVIDHAPEVWLLGSSDYSGALAAHVGLPFAFAQFITAHGGDSVMRSYRDHYRASSREPEPRALLCSFVICAETAAEAERLALSVDLRRVHMARGIEAAVPTLEEVNAHPWTEQERTYARQQRARLVHGDPAQVRGKLEALAVQYGADEIMVLTITGDYASRRRSYELLAEAFELERQ